MAQRSPFYAKRRAVYHNNSACTEAGNIERYNRLPGTGGKRLCQHCARLNKASNKKSARKR